MLKRVQFFNSGDGAFDGRSIGLPKKATHVAFLIDDCLAGKDDSSYFLEFHFTVLNGFE